MRRSVTNLALLLASILVAGFSVELALRFLGYRPWQVQEVKVAVEPGGQFFAKHPTLGYTHLPGKFQVTLADGYTFKVTHLTDTLRITHPLDPYPAAPLKEEIWIFGCSFTHGWTLNDEETYPWRLQARLPEYEVINFGVEGYGTLQSLLQFQEALKRRARPRLVILAYASFHDQRNTLLRVRSKQIVPWNKLGPLTYPYAALDWQGHLKLGMADVVYHEFPLMRYLALAHLIETTYNTKVEDYFYRSHEVTLALIREMAKVAEAHGVKLVVVGLLSDRLTDDTLAYSRSIGLTTGDISVDLSKRENRNLPHDPHPSPLANEQYAQKLAAFLRGTVLSDKKLEIRN